MKKFFNEFMNFINKGNIFEMAVSFIIGAAFGAIVSSAVNDIIMPLIGIVLGGINFASIGFWVGSSYVAYGNFVQQVVRFLIIAFCLFVAIKFMNNFKKKEIKEPEPETKPADIELLEEIRDLLKEKKKRKTKND